jgi:hypothetical protein
MGEQVITIYETEYCGPTDHGTRIKVTNKRTGKYRWHHWDWAHGGGHRQHEHAVRECAATIFERVEYGGETKAGYLWVTTTREDEL